VPAKDGVRLDDRDGPTPGGQERGADEQLQPVDWAQRWSLDVPPEDAELVAKHGVLDDQRVPGSTHVSGHPRELAAGVGRSRIDHNRRTAPRTHSVVREIERNLISLFDHETV
jgi:hypothetical protein